MSELLSTTPSYMVLVFGPDYPGSGLKAQLVLEHNCLTISLPEKATHVLDPTEITLHYSGFNEAQVHLRWQSAQGTYSAVCSDRQIIDDLAHYTDLKSKLDSLNRGHRKKSTARAILGVPLGLLIAAPFVLLLLFFWKSKEIAAWVADLVPITQEQELGQMLFEEQRQQMQLLEDPKVTKVVEEIGKRLSKGSPYQYHWYVVQDPSVNAFAIPGGYIVVHSGLLKSADSAEEVAGVLAHEIQHVEKRHSLENLVQELGLYATLSMVFGNPNVNIISQLAFELGNLSFSREQESEADRFALITLRNAQVNPRGLLTFFKKLTKLSKDDMPSWLSTHPQTEERIKQIESLLEKNGGYTSNPMTYDWNTYKANIK